MRHIFTLKDWELNFLVLALLIFIFESDMFFVLWHMRYQ